MNKGVLKNNPWFVEREVNILGMSTLIIVAYVKQCVMGFCFPTPTIGGCGLQWQLLVIICAYEGSRLAVGEEH